MVSDKEYDFLLRLEQAGGHLAHVKVCSVVDPEAESLFDKGLIERGSRGVDLNERGQRYLDGTIVLGDKRHYLTPIELDLNCVSYVHPTAGQRLVSVTEVLHPSNLTLEYRLFGIRGSAFESHGYTAFATNQTPLILAKAVRLRILAARKPKPPRAQKLTTWEKIMRRIDTWLKR